MLPDGEAGCGIGFPVLGIPGKTGCHYLKLNAMRLEQITLAVGPFTLDKLDHAHFLPMPDCAGGGPKCGGGFAFAVAGEHDEDTALVLSGRHACINLFFQTLLALLMPIITHCDIPGLRPGWASKVIPVLRRLSSPISHR